LADCIAALAAGPMKAVVGAAQRARRLREIFIVAVRREVIRTKVERKMSL